MMNVGIVFYAAQQTRDDALWRIACQHCLTTRRAGARRRQHLARGIFDTATGEFLRQTTHQAGAAIHRGRAIELGSVRVWHRCSYTRDPRFLNTARRAPCSTWSAPRARRAANDWDEPSPPCL